MMPSVDVRRQDKNQRKFSGERLRFAPRFGEKKQIFTRVERTDGLKTGSNVSLNAPQG